MLDIVTRELLDAEVQRLIIPARDVACVYEDHSAEHALLVLIKSRYSAVPVLKNSTHVTGIVSKTMILDAILGLERIEFEQLVHHKVITMMNTDIPRIFLNQTIFRALQMTIDHPFLCVENLNGEFEGLFTRRAILALLHQTILEQKRNP